MSTRINKINWVISTVGVEVPSHWIVFFAPVRILRKHPGICRVIIPRKLTHGYYDDATVSLLCFYALSGSVCLGMITFCLPMISWAAFLAPDGT